ncbi:hypothetical protein KY327_01915 [Candidatus Woesearchaeota archaeon]|nr:hypothetical protein [Candidatus Woesearchaeota archaeon]
MPFLSRAASVARTGVAVTLAGLWPVRTIAPEAPHIIESSDAHVATYFLPRDDRLESALHLSNIIQDSEQETVAAYEDVRKAFTDSTYDWRDPLQSFRLSSFLSDLDYYGRESVNPRREETYDDGWDVLRRRFPHLKPTDCTSFVLSAYAAATGDEAMLDLYQGSSYNPSSFPRRFLDHFTSNDYEAVFLAPDTEAVADSCRYANGSPDGGLTAISMRSLKSGSYYASPYLDLVLADERFEQARPVLESLSGVLAFNDFYHLAFLDRGVVRESRWASNPLLEDNFVESSLYHELAKERGRDGRDWRNAVLLVPEGTVSLLRDYIGE